MIKYLKTLVSLLADVLLELPGLRERNHVVLALLHTGATTLATITVLVVTDINPGGSQGHREGGDQDHHHVQPAHRNDWTLRPQVLISYSIILNSKSTNLHMIN